MALRNRKTTSTRQRSALERIEELREEAQAERSRERELQHERTDAIRRHGEASEALTAALADGREGVAERKALDEAERAASDRWSEKLEAQQRRVRRAKRAVNAYVSEHWAQVAREKRQRDDDARARLEKAAEELDAAIRQVNVEDERSGRSSAPGRYNASRIHSASTTSLVS